LPSESNVTGIADKFALSATSELRPVLKRLSHLQSKTKHVQGEDSQSSQSIFEHGTTRNPVVLIDKLELSSNQLQQSEISEYSANGDASRSNITGKFTSALTNVDSMNSFCYPQLELQRFQLEPGRHSENDPNRNEECSSDNEVSSNNSEGSFSMSQSDIVDWDAMNINWTDESWMFPNMTSSEGNLVNSNVESRVTEVNSGDSASLPLANLSSEVIVDPNESEVLDNVSEEELGIMRDLQHLDFLMMDIAVEIPRVEPYDFATAIHGG